MTVHMTNSPRTLATVYSKHLLPRLSKQYPLHTALSRLFFNKLNNTIYSRIITNSRDFEKREYHLKKRSGSRKSAQKSNRKIRVDVTSQPSYA